MPTCDDSVSPPSVPVLSTASVPGGSPLEWIEECPLCAEFYTDPRTLPCEHIFCFACIEDLRDGINHETSCPLCGTDFTPSDGRLTDLTSYGSQNGCVYHTGEDLAMYCADCRAITCEKCITVGSHASHSGILPLNQAVADLRRQMTDGVEDLLETIGKCRKLLKEVIATRDKFIGAVKWAEKKTTTNSNSDEVDVERDRNHRSRSPRSTRSPDELKSIKAKRLNEIGGVMVDIDRHIVLVDRLRRRTKEVADKGSDGCVVREANASRMGLVRLTNVESLERVVRNLDQLIGDEIPKMR